MLWIVFTASDDLVVKISGEIKKSDWAKIFDNGLFIAEIGHELFFCYGFLTYVIY